MPPRRSQPNWETAAPEYEQGSGCFSFFLLPPLMVVFLSVLFGYFVWDKTPPANFPPASANISPIFRVEIQYWSGSISQWAGAAGLDPNLVATVMQIESCGDPRAKSGAGAVGLFQVMPYHFRAGDDPYAPDTNALRGLAYLSKSLQTAYGDARLALAGYNGGIGVIPRAEWTWAAETKRYVQYGAPIYDDARNGLSSSPALDNWYQHYGASLCRQASQRLGLP
jgi:soluble lytic murein transglycosylase-like protein